MPRKPLPLDHLLQTDHDAARQSLPYDRSASEDRSNLRHEVAFEAMLYTGEDIIAIEASNLSQSGLTFEGALEVGSGQRCLIAMPGMRRRPIDIIWRRGDMAGACFADLLPRAEFDALLSRFEIRKV